MHPTLAGFYPFLLGSPARCAFQSYLCLYICLGSPARSRLSHSAVALTVLGSAEEGSRAEEYTQSVESESELQKMTMVN